MTRQPTPRGSRTRNIVVNSNLIDRAVLFQLIFGSLRPLVLCKHSAHCDSLSLPPAGRLAKWRFGDRFQRPLLPHFSFTRNFKFYC